MLVVENVLAAIRPSTVSYTHLGYGVFFVIFPVLGFPLSISKKLCYTELYFWQGVSFLAQTHKNEEQLATAPIGRLMLKLAVPTVAAQLINMLYNLSLIHI